jgi:hypothetical protein
MVSPQVLFKLRPRFGADPLTCAQSGIYRSVSMRFYQSSPVFKNFVLRRLPKSNLYPHHPVPTEGRFAIVTDVGWDAVDAAARETSALFRGRRSRVVLTPRRWRQVGGSLSADDGDKKARSPGRARRKPLKPLRRECRVISAEPVAATRVLLLHARLRVRLAPGIPCALFFFGAHEIMQDSGARCRENAEVCLNLAHVLSCHRPRKRAIQ